MSQVRLEKPTFHCVGVRCFVTGDENGNAAVKLEYRKRGSAAWKRALDLFGVETEYVKGVNIPAGSRLFAGSVFDLEEDTAYDLRLTLKDADGGQATKTIAAKTWKEPQIPKNGRLRYVVPGNGGGAGTKANPFKGIAAADATAKPGDVFVLARGVYQGHVTFTKSGTAGKPIVWLGAGNDKTIIDGGGASRAITCGDREHVMFQGLTIRNATWALVAHRSSHVTVRRCRFTKIKSGFTSTVMPSRHHVIVDCVFEGPSTWPRTKGIEGSEAVQVIGDGHVVAYNRMAGFADAVSIYRAPSHACDFYNNDISECTDDGIEMDYGGQNTRCFRNRLTNCFQGISVQPLHGGPCYIFRNALYNVGLEIFKMHNNPSGFLMLHNTTVKTEKPVILFSGAPTRNSIFRNNLFIGRGGNYALESTSRMVKCDWDYDGFGGGPWPFFAKWNRNKYRTLEDLAAGAGVETHAVIVDPVKVFAVTVNDLRLKEGTKAIDAGTPLPNVNDGFAGKAPDLGAYEFGRDLPDYGPRPKKR